jgi:hypothetical protein
MHVSFEKEVDQFECVKTLESPPEQAGIIYDSKCI